jgi:hypothetical protein
MVSHIGEDNLMKKAFLTVMLLCLFVLGTQNAQAQEYALGYYNQSWDGTESYSEQYDDPYQELEAMHYNQLYPQQYNQLYPQQYDPYYELEAMHQKYLPQYYYQPYPIYPYPLYSIYSPCCVRGGY